MSSLMNRLIGNLATRMMLIIYLSIIFITGFFIVFAYYNDLALQEERQYDKLKALVSSAASAIDGDEHESLMNGYTRADTAVIGDDDRYQIVNAFLSNIVDANGLSTPMYTLVYDEALGGWYYGVRSGDYVDFKNVYQKAPKELTEQMETGGTIPMYESENGTWLSAFYPVKNRGGKVVALVEADIRFTEFQMVVNERYFKQVMMALGVIVLIALFLIPYARKVLRMDEKQKVVTLQQKAMIEEKNRDIMASIHYALKIQKAMLPSVEMLKTEGIDGFVLHEAKDVVAGDFYWIEEYDDYLYFAVADCTGHGVPGAIMSILCTTAMNNVVDLMGIRDTGKILDEVRRIIVERLEKSGGEVKDGMDIAICRLDKKTKKMQYSGANNPIYIFKKATEEMEVAKPCKQPVGKHINEHPFACKEFQLEKGDVVYLFTDGYADQFGGENGKKLKYKPFRELLFSSKHLSMSEQKELLNSSLKDWMGGFEQVDDICVMGVRMEE